MKLSSVLLIVLFLIGAYSFLVVWNGPVEPLGRLGFVKFANPDMYPGHPHSELLAQYAKDKGSKCALVVHFAGSSNYRSYYEGEVDYDPNYNSHYDGRVYIIELGFIDTQGTGAAGQVNYLDSLKIALLGVPDGRYKFKSDGEVFDTYEEAMDHVYRKAASHGQEGSIPIVWHGTSRQENPVFNQGCGFPLYFYIMSKEYGIIPAYLYTITGMLYPYFENPYKTFELINSPQLQDLYTGGDINYT